MQDKSMQQYWRSSHIAGGNAAYVEDLYEAYLIDANDVSDQWREYFDTLPKVDTKQVVLEDTPHSAVRDHFAKISKMRVRTAATVAHEAQATETTLKDEFGLQVLPGDNNMDGFYYTLLQKPESL